MSNPDTTIRLFAVMAERVSAGEPWQEVLQDYGFCDLAAQATQIAALEADVLQALTDKGAYMQAWARRLGTDDPETYFQGRVVQDEAQRQVIAALEAEVKRLKGENESLWKTCHEDDELIVSLEKVKDAAILVAKWVGHSPSCPFRGCTCESAERLPDALNEFHRQVRRH